MTMAEMVVRRERAFTESDRRWLYSYIDMLLSEPEMSRERFDAWCNAVQSTFDFLRSTRLPKPELPPGIVRMFDPRYIEVTPQEIIFAAAASAERRAT